MTRNAAEPVSSQFQLIGGIRHEPADCCVRMEPGGQAQARKGALYLVTEPAGDPALGSDACRLVQSTIVREYYADPSLSLTTSLTNALNKANQALIAHNRQVLAAGDPPPGLPRRIRVGLTVAIVRPGTLYLCQLSPGLALWIHQGQLAAFPRPKEWGPAAPQVNGDGEVVPNLYPAPALGTYPVVEADFAYRRIDRGDLLILCSSNLSRWIEEDAARRVLTEGGNAEIGTTYLHRLAALHELAEAHAMAIEVSATAAGGGHMTLPLNIPTLRPAAPAAPVHDEGALVDLIGGVDAPANGHATGTVETPAAPATGGLGGRLSTITGQLRERWGRPRAVEPPPLTTNGADLPASLADFSNVPAPWELDSQRIGSPVAPPAPDLPPGGKVVPLRRTPINVQPSPPAPATPAPHTTTPPEDYDDRDLPEYLRWRPSARRQELAEFVDVLKSGEGEDRHPTGGSETQAVPLEDPAPPRPNPVVSFLGGVAGRLGVAGRKAAPVVGKMGKATLSGVGGVMSHTLPESVRQRGADGMFYPDGHLTVEEEPDPEMMFTDNGTADEAAPDDSGPGGSSIYDAAATVQPTPTVAPGVFKVLVPVAIVILLGVLFFSVQGIMSGQQTARTKGYLSQAQQAEMLSRQSTDVGERRKYLLQAVEYTRQALDADPRSQEAQTLNVQIQREMDDLSGVVRLAGLTLLTDLTEGSQVAPAPVLTATPSLGVISDTTTSTTTVASPAARGDYLSQVLVHGDNVFLLDKGAGKLYRYALSTHERTALLSPGETVGSNGGGDVTVKQLIFMTWRPTSEGGDLAALDDAHVAYLWLPDTGQWTAYPLGGTDGLDKPRDMTAYDGNLYLLWAKPGQVSKWLAGQYDGPPTDWFGDPASTELRGRNPISLAVDGDMYLLLGNGQVVLLTAGEVKKTFALPVWPSIASPLALFTDSDSQSIYVVEAGDKRIIRLAKDGTVQMQLKAPVDKDYFDNLRNVYVDEVGGKIYILSGKRLYVATLPSLTGPTVPTPAPTKVP